MTTIRKSLDQIENIPEPSQLYDELMASAGWQYKTRQDYFLTRDRALVALLYLGDFRAIEVLPLTKANFEAKSQYILVKNVLVAKKRKRTIREAMLPVLGKRAVFTKLILDYLELLEDDERLFKWSLEYKTTELKNQPITTKDGSIKKRYSKTCVGTCRSWQIVKALLPNYTQHWLRAFGYNYDYDNMKFDIFAVSDKTKANPSSLQPYIRRRYQKYPVR